MPENLDVIVAFLLVFVASYAAAHVVTRKTKTINPVLLDLPIEGQLKVLCSGGSYRCRILAVTTKGIKVSAPLRDDRHVPLRSGERIVGQCGVPDGLLTFHSSLIGRDIGAHTLLIAVPSAMRRSERRSEPRSRALQGKEARIDGSPGEIVDCSSNGVRVLTKARPNPGDLVAVHLPKEIGQTRGYVLDVHSAYYDGGLGREVRIRFEDQVAALNGQFLHTVC